jgi:secondary thiamine-phosphate synthase enzyme
MPFHIATVSTPTLRPVDVIDITNEVRDALESSGFREGTVTILSRHSTAYVNINEKEPQLVQDMVTFLKRLVPKDGDYLHNINPIDGRDNAHSHLMGLFMNCSETIPFTDGKLLLGKWQSIFLIELDGPRPERNVLVQISGQ